jgi:hypothetical protein
MAGVDIYAAERERQQTGKTMICDFFDNITPHQKSVDLKAITQKYDSYREIDSEITRLSLQLAEETRKLNAFLTIKESSKQRHRNTIATIQGQLATLNSDKQIFDSVFRDYETNLRRNNNISYLLNFIIFFEVVRNNCDLAVQARTNYDDDVPTVLATSENPNTGGRKSRKRKSRKRKAKKSKKSKKSRK